MLSIKVLSPPEVFTNPSRNFLCSLEGRNNGCALRPTGTVQSRPAPWAFFFIFIFVNLFFFSLFFLLKQPAGGGTYARWWGRTS